MLPTSTLGSVPSPIIIYWIVVVVTDTIMEINWLAQFGTLYKYLLTEQYLLNNLYKFYITEGNIKEKLYIMGKTLCFRLTIIQTIKQ
jgi:hypothetical protein